MLILAAAIGYFVYTSERPGSAYTFRKGLDLSGGTHLVYKADVTKLAVEDIASSMAALRDDVEHRVNAFHVSEPIVQIEQGKTLSSKESAYKLIVELPGITNVDDAVKAIGATPRLDFRLATAKSMNEFQASSSSYTSTTTLAADYLALFQETGLNGGMVSRASLDFNQTTHAPQVNLAFNDEGRELFGKITKENTGDYLGIFLDGKEISRPSIREPILDGKAVISGEFKTEEAKELIRNINFGALPVPISLISQSTIGPSLGQSAVNGGIKAGIVSFLVIAFFLVIWYRLPGFIAVLALACYVILNLAIFKIGISPTLFVFALFFAFLSAVWDKRFLVGIPVSYLLLMLVPGALAPVTLTAAGIAGLVLSIGMAVDANILIFERMKEELARGRGISDAMHEGFDRAWLSIRDSNTSSIITGIILYVFGSTSVVTGFALVFVVGVFVSMFTAITASRLFLYAVAPARATKLGMFLVSNGFFNKKKLEHMK